MPSASEFAVPWVTIIETPEGKALRVKVKRTLSSFEMVRIPGGIVEMPAIGADGKIDPTRTQRIAVKPFWIGRTEVPWDLYDIWFYSSDLSPPERMEIDARSGPTATGVRPGKPYNDPTYGFGREGFPAISIHPHAAGMYCRWMSSITGKTYRLPTEAEWILACRAGRRAEKPHARELAKVAWFIDNSFNPHLATETTHPIATKAANAYGLHDMLGNVAEWVIAADGQVVLMGGSFMSAAADVHCAAREPFDMERLQMRDPKLPKDVGWLSDAPHAGFRLVREE